MDLCLYLKFLRDDFCGKSKRKLSLKRFLTNINTTVKTGSYAIQGFPATILVRQNCRVGREKGQSDSECLALPVRQHGESGEFAKLYHILDIKLVFSTSNLLVMPLRPSVYIHCSVL